MAIKFLPDLADDRRLTPVPDVNEHIYENQVQRSSDWDTTYAFRLAEAIAKDRARMELIRRVDMEAKRLSEESMTTLSASYFSSADGNWRNFRDQARQNVEREIDGVAGASLNAIKL
jgi:hypothetical protein